jgi:hypothetical protein
MSCDGVQRKSGRAINLSELDLRVRFRPDAVIAGILNGSVAELQKPPVRGQPRSPPAYVLEDPME